MGKAHFIGTETKSVPSGKLSYAEFLDWADEDTLAEWEDGEVILTSPASLKHQNILLLLGNVLGGFVAWQNLGLIILPPFQMKLPTSGREPDLLFVKTEHLDRLRETFLDGPADLVVEIISPESIERDRQTKFRQYAEGGVPEYWLLDPLQNGAEFYRLNAQGRYEVVGLEAEGKYYPAALPGFWVRPAWLWTDPLPAAQDVLLQVGGQAYLAYLTERLAQQSES